MNSSLEVHNRGELFFVSCPYDLDGVPAPPLGPYDTIEAASHACDEILEVVCGSSD